MLFEALRGVPSAKQVRQEEEQTTMRQVKIIFEKHPDGYVAYPLGVEGVVVGEGETYKEALANVRSAIKFHVESFGTGVLDGDHPVPEAFVAEAGVDVATTPRTICARAGISRDEFMEAYNRSQYPRVAHAGRAGSNDPSTRRGRRLAASDGPNQEVDVL
jgi:predicted RNase H-like HicB family nuclease